MLPLRCWRTFIACEASGLLSIILILLVACPGLLLGQETATSSSYTDLAWEPICSSDSYYDYVGTLKFCQYGASVFGYRINDSDPCGALAPLIRMTAGKKYKLRLQNQGREATNLHTHGLHIVGEGNGDDIDREVGAGQWLLLNYTIAEYHMDGTYWYHAHRHLVTTKHLGGGALGMLIIDPAESNTEQRPAYIEKERKLLVADIFPGLLVNGKLGAETIELTVNEWHRLRVVYSTLITNWPTPLLFDETNCQVHVMAYDGVWRSVVPKPEDEYEFEVTHASRLDFAIKCASNSSLRYGWDGTTKLVDIVVTGSGVGDIGPPETWIPERPRYLQDLRDVIVPNSGPLGTYQISLGFTNINSERFDRKTPMETFQYDSLQQWYIAGFSHNFHMHIHHMQVVTPGGCGGFYEEGEWFDVIAPTFFGCFVRFRLADYGGRITMHCHITEHSDDGAINWVDVVGGPGLEFSDFEATNSAPEKEMTCTAGGSSVPSDAPTYDTTTTVSSSPPSTVESWQPSEVPSTHRGVAPSELFSIMPSASQNRQSSDAPSNASGAGGHSSYYPSEYSSGGPSDFPSDVATQSESPSIGPTSAQSSTPSGVPTWTPSSQPTSEPTLYPSAGPTVSVTESPTLDPTTTPTLKPTTQYPTSRPSDGPTIKPTTRPTTSSPTSIPSTQAPTDNPTNEPTIIPSSFPTSSPSLHPSSYPSFKPTSRPTTEAPTPLPTTSPSINPTTTVPTTLHPTSRPTDNPTVNPTIVPTLYPTTISPTSQPTKGPTYNPTSHPTTDQPTPKPTSHPSTEGPIPLPTSSPTTVSPTIHPSSNAPTDTPPTTEPLISVSDPLVGGPKPAITGCDPGDDVSLTVYNTDTNELLEPLGDIFNICYYENVGLTIVAYPECKEKMKFKLKNKDDIIIQKNTEGVAPFSLNGDIGKNLIPTDSFRKPGLYTLEMNPVPGRKQIYTFTVVGC